MNEDKDFDGDEVEEREGDKDEEGEGESERELEVRDDEDEDKGDRGASVVESSGSLRDGHTRPFVLPKIWTVNDFKLTITTNIFKNLRDRY